MFARFDNVFIVTSIDRENRKDALANYSPRFVHTAAPGVDILTTAPGGGYERVKGTTLAAAHVAGALALAISKHGNSRSYADYYKILISSEGGNDIPGFEHLTIGRNSLNVVKFLAALAK